MSTTEPTTSDSASAEPEDTGSVLTESRTADSASAGSKAATPIVIGGSTLASWGVLVVLLAVIIACVGYIGVHVVKGSNDSVPAQREQVMALGDKFIERVNTYGPKDIGKDKKTMPGYRSRVGDLLTPKFKSNFMQNVTWAEATVAEQGAGRTVTVHSTGVAAMDKDTATVLVVGEVAVSYPKSSGSKERVTAGRQLFRSEVKLVKQKDTWLVDDWSPAEEAPNTDSTSGVTP